MGGKRAKGAKLISSGHFILLCLSFYQQKLTARIESNSKSKGGGGRKMDGFLARNMHAMIAISDPFFRKYIVEGIWNTKMPRLRTRKQAASLAQ